MSFTSSFLTLVLGVRMCLFCIALSFLSLFVTLSIFTILSSLIGSRQMSGDLSTEEGQIPVFQLITLYSEYLNISRIRFSVVPDVGLN